MRVHFYVRREAPSTSKGANFLGLLGLGPETITQLVDDHIIYQIRCEHITIEPLVNYKNVINHKFIYYSICAC